MPPDSAHPPPHGSGAEFDRLRRAAAAWNLALDEVALARLLQYRDGLVRWNQVYNLTAVRDPVQMLDQHLVDCLSLIPPLRRHAASRQSKAVGTTESLRVLDVGSGGGLPGIVIAILQPDWQVHCVDAVAKKAAFIRQMGAELRLPNLQALHARVETLQPSPMGYDVVTSRAFASLADFTRLTSRGLAQQGVWVAMKGQSPDAEVAALSASVDVFHVEPVQLPGLDVQRCLVWMRPVLEQPTNGT